MEDLGLNVYDKFNEVFNEKFNFWDVDEAGNIVRKDQKYEIGCERLTEMNWLNQVIRKNEKLLKVNFTSPLLKHLEEQDSKD